VYYLEHVDSICSFLGLKKHFFTMVLPKGCYIIPQKEKFIWTVSQETTHATVVYVKDSLFKGSISNISVHIDAVLLKNATSDNIVGVLRGEVKDTFLAITAHYDHLGMMGNNAIFPGASDNASGTAMLLYMAKYFSTHKQHYSILFISFSGEEAGLMGSDYFTKHPLVPLSNIRFLTNIDIMGDATDGITVVNATEYPKQFEQLQKINKDNNLLAQIKSRGKAANSDHYHFSEAGVPSFFIYTNGGTGYYHDIYDKAGEITLNHVDNIVTLIIDFLKELK
jgi:Zn-dependent M28 family amino/carboxypeptidase